LAVEPIPAFLDALDQLDAIAIAAAKLWIKTVNKA
jgi:hypothetical protein